MTLDSRIRELIAVGTAVGANCHSCLEHHVGKARELGIPDEEIADAVETGKSVRRGAHGRMDKLARDLLATEGASAPSRCGCGA